MARPRKFKDVAEKQRAYNERKKLKSQGIVTNGIAPFKGETLRHAQDVWCRRNGSKIVEEKETAGFKSMVFLIQSNDNKDLFAVFQRIPGARRAKAFSWTDEGSARDLFEELATGRVKDPLWYGIEHYYKQAKAFIIESEKNPNGPVPFFTPRYGFLLALEELLSDGWEAGDGFPARRPGIGNRSANFRKVLRNNRRKILYNVGNQELGSSLEETRIQIKKMIEAMIDRYEVIGSKTYWRNNSLLMKMAEVASDYPRAFPQFVGLRDKIKKDIKQLETSNFKTSDSDGKILAEDNHPFVPIEQLTKILQVAFNENINLYDFIVLSLTTGLRPEEMRRLIKFKTAYLKSDRSLNYKHLNPHKSVSNIFLTKKTEAKVKRSDLSDPLLSIVGHIILKNCNPMIEPEFFFEKKSPEHFRVKHEDLEPYYERTLRTTCATMLAFCDKAKVGRADLYTVKARLAHKDLKMAIERYAKHPPTESLKPEVYFGITGLKHQDSGMDLGNGESLWDMWLLRDWINRRKTIFTQERDSAALNRMWKMIINEAKAFQKTLSSDQIEDGISVV